MSRQKFVTSSLPLDASVAYITAAQLRDLCDRISPSTLERYRNDLLDFSVPGFSYYMYTACYDRRSAECVWQYRQIIKQVGKAIAEAEIKQHLREYFNES